jgi:hypothetical protein
MHAQLRSASTVRVCYARYHLTASGHGYAGARRAARWGALSNVRHSIAILLKPLLHLNEH